ncbi:MAG: hypothetical protein LUG62_01910, partial [Clostridiales bacterium]|nr:hypothetical protein [Clostridiales bacterium]
PAEDTEYEEEEAGDSRYEERPAGDTEYEGEEAGEFERGESDSEEEPIFHWKSAFDEDTDGAEKAEPSDSNPGGSSEEPSEKPEN